MKTTIRLLATAAAVMMSVVSAHATVITFDVSSYVSDFKNTHTQNGYNVTYASGALRIINNNPNYGDILAGQNYTGGSFDLTRADGGIFSLQNFAGGSGLPNTTVTYTLTGYLAGTQTYSEILTATGTTNFAKDLFTFSPTTTVNKFDRINFSIMSSQSSPLVDNINLTEIAATPPAPTPDPVPPVTIPGSVSPVSAVPEPTTWALMLAGFGLTATALRRRRHDAAVRFA